MISQSALDEQEPEQADSREHDEDAPNTTVSSALNGVEKRFWRDPLPRGHAAVRVGRAVVGGS